MSTINVIPSSRVSQRGSALGVSLIFLVLLTLLGLTAMQDTGLQERMAGNARDKDMALQAGEAALRDAEAFLMTPVLPAFNGGTSGLIAFDRDAARASYWDDDSYDWANDSRSYGGADIEGVASQPRYVIEELPQAPLAGESLAADEPLEDHGSYRITARAEGGTSDAVTILQTVYRR
jgi:type IV pilus assembly protein PilX